MGKISAAIIARNEEHRIEQCIRSLDGVADEIVVVDSFSTDRTVEICRELGCRVVQRRFTGFGAQRQYATSLTSHSYVLSLDADEVLSPALRESLMKLKEGRFDHRVYSFSRLNFYCGRPVKQCGWYPDRQIRLFNKSYANWNLRDVFEKVIFPETLRPQAVDGDILHYRCTTPEEYRRAQQHHAGISGHVLAVQHPRIRFYQPHLNAIKAFLSTYIAEGGITGGADARAICAERYRCVLMAWRLARRLNRQSQT